MSLTNSKSNYSYILVRAAFIGIINKTKLCDQNFRRTWASKDLNGIP